MPTSDNIKKGVVLAGVAGLAGLGISNLKPKSASAQGFENIEEDYNNMDLKDILEKLLETERSMLSILQGKASANNPNIVPNANNIRAMRVPITVGIATQLPTLFVPDEMELKIKAGWANGGQIYIGESSQAALNQNQAEPLIRSEFTTYRIKNADALYITGTVAGDFVTIVAEQRS
jgi:hypothetical protein